ncbi:hypothetical protein [Streptomyces sp. DT171]|uniref:hypothetical protein n=1 Tax=Streptomyces sp. DT171 TaxID=3416524 RepID=UPI003CE68C74
MNLRHTLDYLARLVQQDADRQKAAARGEQCDAPADYLASTAAHAWVQRAEAEQRAETAEQDAERFKADHEAACRTIADMHEAATGRTGMGPIRGVVEDVADVRARAQEMETDRDRWRDATEERIHRHNDYRRRLAAVLALPANSHFNDIIEYAARTLTRNGERLLAAEEAVNRRDATLQRVRDADTLADALTAVGEHDGLPPEAARAAAEFAAAAEQPAAIDAERERDHAITLAVAEQARAEAVHVADRATQTLLRIKHARTAADAWTALGAHYHLPATEAGRRARDWRSTAERYATERAEAASVLGAQYMGDAERYQSAWHSARIRAQREASHSRACRISRDAWRRDATAAKAAVSRVRALLETRLGPLATKAVLAALDTPEG